MPPHRDGQVSAGARIVARSRRIPDVSFRSFLAGRTSPRVHWVAPDGLEIAACGAAARLTADGPERFEAVRDEGAELFDALDAPDDAPAATRPRLFGGFAFHADHDSVSPWDGFPGAEFVLPRVQLTRTDSDTWLTVAVEDVDEADALLAETRSDLADLPTMRPAGSPPGVETTRHTTSREEWCAQVRRATDRIDRGELRKVVLATALEVTLSEPVSVPDVLERLRASYPDCYRFLLEPSDGGGFFGAPPERLVSLSGRTVETEALAGTVGRGETPEEDDELAAELLDSEKVREEHALVAETIRDCLAPLAESVTVGSRGLRRLSTIQHLQTPISATLSADGHVLDVVEALHPTPAVGGLPPDAAMRTIRETETFDRGWYASPVGWFDADGDGEFAVAIRAGVAAGDRATLFAGNGIVADSDPDDEWEEVQLKYLPIFDELE
ncbi:isochorismate synthase [Halomicrococcus sp. NG-SE-24]|uniref:isochorismate synthase n=1 Tax=Halomicrococcus sp. NG-SE-24 TaxID=3436928 RepID=UPI003D976F9D